MSVKIRILGSANRTMQRTGFLKLLCVQAARRDTSNLETLGRQFVQSLLKRVRLTPPYSESVRDYVRIRLTDKVYHDLRKAVLNEAATNPAVSLELQDLYLSDSSLVSSTGKLVEAGWRLYPYLATSLGFVKIGTYSAMTRGLVLLAVTPKDEIAAFQQYDEKHNPLRITAEQAAVFLASMRTLPLGGKRNMISRHLEKVVDELDRNPVIGMRWLRLFQAELNRRGWSTPDG